MRQKKQKIIDYVYVFDFGFTLAGRRHSVQRVAQ